MTNIFIEEKIKEVPHYVFAEMVGMDSHIEYIKLNDFDTALKEAYKKGFIDGGIEQLCHK